MILSTGYSDNSVEGEWRWVDCTESNDWQMTIWAPGSPGNEMPDCGSLSLSGEVEAQVCDVPLNYVCEVSPKGKMTVHFLISSFKNESDI